MVIIGSPSCLFEPLRTHKCKVGPFNSVSAYTQTIKVNESKHHKNTHKMSITFLQHNLQALLPVQVQKQKLFPYYHIALVTLQLSGDLVLEYVQTIFSEEIMM